MISVAPDGRRGAVAVPAFALCVDPRDKPEDDDRERCVS